MSKKPKYPKVGQTWWRAVVEVKEFDETKFSVRAWPVRCVGFKRGWVEWEMESGERYKTNGPLFRNGYGDPSAIGKGTDDALKAAVTIRLSRLFHGRLSSKSKRFQKEIERFANLFVREFYPEHGE